MKENLIPVKQKIKESLTFCITHGTPPKITSTLSETFPKLDPVIEIKVPPSLTPIFGVRLWITGVRIKAYSTILLK